MTSSERIIATINLEPTDRPLRWYEVLCIAWCYPLMLQLRVNMHMKLWEAEQGRQRALETSST